MKRRDIWWCDSEIYVNQDNNLHRKLVVVMVYFSVPYKGHKCLTDRFTIGLPRGTP